MNDLKLGDSSGAVALWIGPGTEGYFTGLRDRGRQEAFGRHFSVRRGSRARCYRSEGDPACGRVRASRVSAWNNVRTLACVYVVVLCTSWTSRSRLKSAVSSRMPDPCRRCGTASTRRHRRIAARPLTPGIAAEVPRRRSREQPQSAFRRSFCRALGVADARRFVSRVRDTMSPGESSTVGAWTRAGHCGTYLLKQNGFPEGGAELTPDADALGAIRDYRKGQARVRFGPARSSGNRLPRSCARQSRVAADQRENEFESTGALDTASKTSSRQEFATIQRTDNQYLENPFPSPGVHRGRRVAATGFLVRRADGDGATSSRSKCSTRACVTDKDRP